MSSEKEKKDDANPPMHPEEKELFGARIVLVSTSVNAKLAHDVNSKLLALERVNPEAPVYLFINSPGGEIYSGFSIFDTARFIRPEVVTVVTGLAASMGSIIALCAKPQYRYAFPNSKFLIHQPSINGGLGGSVSDIEIHAKDLLETKDKIVSLYVEETGADEDLVRKSLDRDYWMSPKAALGFGKHGLISKIVQRREDIDI